MKQEDKDLLLLDLCSRLPYGVKGIEANSICLLDTSAYFKSLIKNIEYKIGHLGFKPYLFPLSSMTVEQRCKVQNLLPNNCDISFKNQKITFHNEEGSVQLDKLEKLFNFFNLYHIDYRGLIPMGLAIDATGLNIY